MRYYPTRAIGPLVEAVGAAIGRFNDQEVTNTVWALARMGHHPGRVLAAMDAVILAQLPNLTSQAVSNLLWALSVLQARPGAAEGCAWCCAGCAGHPLGALGGRPQTRSCPTGRAWLHPCCGWTNKFRLGARAQPQGRLQCLPLRPCRPALHTPCVLSWPI